MSAFRSITFLFVMSALAACGSSPEPGPAPVQSQLTLQLSSSDITVEAGQQAFIQLVVLGATQEVRFEVAGLPGYATLTGDQIRLAPQRADAGEATLTVTAKAGGASDSKQLRIRVTRANAAPEFSNIYLRDHDGIMLFFLSPEGVTVRGTPYLQVDAKDADRDAVQLLAEMVPTSAAFTGVPTHSTVLAQENQELAYFQLELPGMEAGVPYRIQVWVRDAYGAETRRSELGPVTWSPRPSRPTTPELRTCEGQSVDVRSDARHCGACGHDCLGAACQAGLCVPEQVIPASGLFRVTSDLTVGGGYVYVAGTGDGGGLLRVPASQGAPERLTDRMVSLVLAGSAGLYYTDSWTVPMYMPSWGAAGVPAAYDQPVENSLGLYEEGGWLYWASRDVNGPGRGHPVLRAPAVDGALPETLVEVPSSTAMTLDASGGYIALTTGIIMHFPLQPAASLTPIARDVERVSSLAADAQYLYVAAGQCSIYCPKPETPFTLARVPKTGGTLEVLASSPTSIHELRVDDRFVYWVNYARTSDLPLSLGTLMRIPKEGGTPQVLADGFDSVRDMVIDGQYAWWLANSGLYRVAK